MRLRVPASWKDYHTGFVPGQLPDQTKKAAGAALCSSLPLFTRCAEACAGRSIPYKQLSVPQIVRVKMYKPEIPDDVSNTGPRYKNYQTRKEHYHDTEEICQTRESSRGNCGGRRLHFCDSLRHPNKAPLADLVHPGCTRDGA